MKPKFIAKRSVILLLAVVLLTGCLIPHAANNETAQEAGGIPDPLISTTSNIDALPELSTDSTLLSDPESLAEAEAAYRERMQRERAEGILADSKIADYVNTDEFFETKPMFRLTALETLNSYVVQNADNTNTIYFMSENVKYVDAKGEIREKDVRLSATEKGFAVTDSDVKLLLPLKLSDGIDVNTDFGSLSLIPQLRAERAAKFNEKSNSVLYSGAFGSGSSLRYTPTLSGVKEDIILETRPEENSFEFRMETQGLYLAEEDGIYYLVSTDNKDSRIRLNQIYIYDANGRFTAGEMSVIDEGRGKFLLTVAAPMEFLDAAETTYPVTIDPSINVYTNQYSSNIIDAAVHQNKPNMNAGTWQYDNIGYTDSTYGLARTVIKLSALLSDSTYQSLTASQINSVTFSAMEATGNSSKTVKLHPITGTPTWTESTVTWNNYGSFDTTVNYGGTLTGDVWTHFNITNLVKAWKNGSYNGNGCFIFIMGGTESSQCRALYSTEYSGTSNRPYLSFTYTSSLTINDDSVDVEEDDTYQLSVTVDPAGSTITYSVDDTDIATVSSTGLVTGIKAGTTFVTVFAGGNCRLVMIYVVIEDGVYTLKSAQADVYLTTYKYVEEGYKVRLNFLIQNEPIHEQIRQMWKIKYLGSGRYSIRPVRMLFMGLSSMQEGSFTYATAYDIGTVDSLGLVSDNAKWVISKPDSSTKIAITLNGQSSKTLQGINGYTNNDTSVVLAQSSTNNYALWYPEKINDVPVGIYLYDTDTREVMDSNSCKYIAPDEELTKSSMQIMAVGYSENVIQQSFIWTSGSKVQITNPCNPVFRGLTPGLETVHVYWNDGAYYSVSASFNLRVTEIANGTYYLKNKESWKHLDINNQNMSNGTNVIQMDLNENFTQRWVFTRIEDDYYSIVSANSGTTPYYLGQEHDTAFNDNIVISSGSVDDGKKWKVEVTSSGAYKIMTKKGRDNYYPPNYPLYVLSVDPIETGYNGGNIVQALYTNDSNYRDEWIIYRYIHFGISSDNYTDGCNSGERLSYRYANKFYYEVQSAGGYLTFLTHHYNKNTTRTASKLDFSVNGAISNDIDFMVYIGHGYAAQDNNGNYLHYNCAANGSHHTTDCQNPIYNAYIEDMSLGSSTSALRWVWFYTCNVLKENSYTTDADLKGTMNGVHIVMGYETRATLCDNMAETFGDYLEYGVPIIEAYFNAGRDGEASQEPANHYQKVFYVSDAEFETIYSPRVNYYYTSADVQSYSMPIHRDWD